MIIPMLFFIVFVIEALACSLLACLMVLRGDYITAVVYTLLTFACAGLIGETIDEIREAQ